MIKETLMHEAAAQTTTVFYCQIGCRSALGAVFAAAQPDGEVIT